ncbi:putative dehydrogenase [Micromonospora sp. Llam0]|uniref:Gfo/Idh/MocA family protein n=1 Tax=Micromonospora sp. Llam0 TaxID=2485143 RepID=UPI000F491337|nr:Gfo/Idh/MocA family oxidoreductase [Micromonospora sp. Llam0]ROO59741.1 putative dehydrogenase [Micromonospora sp. Llam0]
MRIAILAGSERYTRWLRDAPGVELVTGGADAVVVGGELAARRDLVERAAAAGAHVLCEPPLAPTEVDAERMIEACSRAGVGLTMALPIRFGPAFAALRRTIADGELGRLLTVGGTVDGPGPDAAAALIDLVDVLLDGEPAKDVYAQASPGPSVLTVRYPSGVVATFGCGWDTTAMEFTGERATVRFDPFPRLLDVRGPERANADAAMLEAFVAGVRNGWTTGPDGETALRSLRIVRAAQQSIRNARPEAVN